MALEYFFHYSLQFYSVISQFMSKPMADVRDSTYGGIFTKKIFSSPPRLLQIISESVNPRLSETFL